ncbi:MAG: NAD(P)H-dependent oxidoreductase subunit E [Candidatus Methanofastidiosia archaeon]
MKGDSPPHKSSGMISGILREFEPGRGNLLPILHRLQESSPNHYLSEEALEKTAAYLNLSCATVHGVASFYSMFSTEPRGKYIIRVCTSPSCHVQNTILGTLEEVLGISLGGTTSDHLFTLESSSCLGLCDRTPVMMINDEIYDELTPEKARDILERKSHE